MTLLGLRFTSFFILILVCQSFCHGALIGYYNFDETAGPARIDSAGGGTDNATFNGSGALYSQAAIPNGTYGALTLAGTPFSVSGGLSVGSGEWKTSAGASFDNVINNFTVMAWINPASTGANQRVFGRDRLSGAANNGWSFGLNNGTEIMLTGHAVADIVSSGAAITAGTWQHIAITKSSAGVSFYKNGNLVSTSTIAGATGNFTAVSGALPDWLLLNTFAGQNFVGLVDELRIYDNVLTQTQIQTAAVTAVPEPTCFALGAAAIGLLTLLRRKAG